MAHETIKYGLDDVPELFNTCFIKGTILTVNESNNSADISTAEYGTLYDIPIFYHCPNESDTSLGYNAFEEDDEVVVIVPNAVNNQFPDQGKIKIVGFWDNQPRPCLGEGFFMATLGNRAVIWDIAKRQYATGIIDDNGQEITSWPVAYDLLDDWLALTFQIGETGVSQWGGSDLFQRFVSCGFVSSPNCVLKSDNKDADNTVYVLSDETEQDHCESTRYQCSQDTDTNCDPPLETKLEKRVTNNDFRVTVGLSQVTKYWTGGTRWGTYNATVNGDTIQMADVQTDYSDEGYDEIITQYYTCSESNPEDSWEYEIDYWFYSDNVSEIHTPWGKMFEGVEMVDRTIQKSAQSSGSGAFDPETSQDYENCSGFEKVAQLNDPVRDARYQRRFYQEATGGFAEGNVMGAFLVGFIKQKQYNQDPNCGTPTQGDDIRLLDAIGVIAFYEDNTTVDFRNETETPNVREGLINLVKAYHTDQGDEFANIQTFRVRHRKYITDL